MLFQDSIDLTFVLRAGNTSLTSEQMEIREKTANLFIRLHWSTGSRGSVHHSAQDGERRSSSAGVSQTHSNFIAFNNVLRDSWLTEQSQGCESILHLDPWTVKTR